MREIQTTLMPQEGEKIPAGGKDVHKLSVVPRGHIWLEGDNSLVSYDSRDHGAIPFPLVQGRVWYKVCCTVEPPNNGHVGDECFVLYSEVVPSSEVLTCMHTVVGMGHTVCPL